jgi:hypothetical protein
MTMLADTVDAVIGVHTHTDSHTVCLPGHPPCYWRPESRQVVRPGGSQRPVTQKSDSWAVRSQSGAAWQGLYR